MKRCFLFLMAMAILCFIIAACSNKAAPPKMAEITPEQLKLFEPFLPDVITSAGNPISDQKIELGRMLYFDARLSRSQQISCNSCHGLDTYGVDGSATSSGHNGKHGDRNSPTVYNAAGQFVQFWDGRAPNVEEQAKGPVLNPVEMAMQDDQHVVLVLKSMPGYVAAFKTAFPGEKDPVTYDNMGKAIGAFERKLVTPARWDKFLKGDPAALSPVEKVGFTTFMETGCQTCHSGTYVGGRMYQRLGMIKPWPDASDPGLAKVTKSDADQLVFKVPSLRNVEKTAPYFHNGKVASLQEAVGKMAEFQLGKQLTDPQTQSIITWLRTLTGDVPTDLIKPPVLPKSTGATPKPDISD